MMSDSMDPDCLAPDRLPHVSRLYSVYLTNPEKLADYYAHLPDWKGIRAAGREVSAGRASFPPEMRAAIARVLREQNARFAGGALGKEVERNLARLESGAAAIVTGQQVGLLGGPAYTSYKALSTLQVAAEITKHGMEAVPIFWMAGEDHDLAEVNHVYWQTAGALQRLEWAGDPQIEGRSVGTIPLGAATESLVRMAADGLSGAFAADLAAELKDAYSAKETFASAFARLMAALFAKRGLILLDPQDARLHQLAIPLLQRAAQQQEETTAAMLAQSKKLEKAGYHVQVKVTERSTFLFRNLDGRRVALKRINSGFAAATEHFSARELAEAIATSPESFSPNALLRPVMQDFLLPTAAYIGGPAEIAYFAQNSVLYKCLLGRMPAILPRASFTLVEPEVARLLQRYELAPADVFGGRQYLRARMEARHVPRGLAAKFDSEIKKLKRVLSSFDKPLNKLDPTLKEALETVSRKMLYQMEKLRMQAGRAADFRAGVLARHEKAIVDALYPEHGLQERSLSLLPFLARHGEELLDGLEKKSGLNLCAHQIVRL